LEYTGIVDKLSVSGRLNVLFSFAEQKYAVTNKNIEIMKA